jgi:hypothetical protein
MKDILFRGLCNNDTGVWYYGYFVKQNKPYPICQTFIFSESGSRYSVKPLSVGRFTSHYDKKGNKIFEHDIFTSDKTPNANFIVFYENGQLQFKGFVNGRLVEHPFVSPEYCKKHFEVIGNIHENLNQNK